MTTLIIKGRGAQSRHFLEYARTLPFVEVVEEKESQYSDVTVNRNKAECREPDEDFYRSVTMKEFKEKALTMVEDIDKMYSGK